jgi:GABA permease
MSGTVPPSILGQAQSADGGPATPPRRPCSRTSDGPEETMHRYLVVANQSLDSDELMELVRERVAAGPAEFWLVVPATPVKDLASNAMPIPMPVMGGIATLPAPPEEARRMAQAKLDAAVQKLTAAGVRAKGTVADPDPLRAVEEAMSSGEFDEIIVSTLPARVSRWLHHDLPGRLEQTFHLPVTQVHAKDV